MIKLSIRSFSVIFKLCFLHSYQSFIYFFIYFFIFLFFFLFIFLFIFYTFFSFFSTNPLVRIYFYSSISIFILYLYCSISILAFLLYRSISAVAASLPLSLLIFILIVNSISSFHLYQSTGRNPFIDILLHLLKKLGVK